MTERSQKPEDIYENVNDVCLELRTHAEKIQPPQNTGSVSVKNRKPRAAEVCLCVLCVLLLTAVIVFCVCFINERKHSKNLTEERENILNQNKKLTEERENILNQNKKLTEERETILNQNKKLTEEKEQALKDKNLLNQWLNERDRLADNFKWIYYGLSFYYISSEKKSWSDSRRYCQQKGADLAVIKEEEKTEFLQKFVVNDSFWVGWRQTDNVWKWIDDPTVANRFGANSSNCAGLTKEKYYSYPCDSAREWICKKTYNQA